MKLILAIVRDTDAEVMVSRLVAQGYRVTRIASSGGFLRKGSVTLVIGVEPEKVQSVIDLLKEVGGATEPGQHRVTLFVVNALRFEQI
jgi:uncharacterized protein YaaQ